jgi:hypothetical protein
LDDEPSHLLHFSDVIEVARGAELSQIVVALPADFKLRRGEDRRMRTCMARSHVTRKAALAHTPRHAQQRQVAMSAA